MPATNDALSASPNITANELQRKKYFIKIASYSFGI